MIFGYFSLDKHKRLFFLTTITKAKDLRKKKTIFNQTQTMETVSFIYFFLKQKYPQQK